jgi:3,5-epimerase/4-reductase
MPINDEFNTRNFITKITNYEKICSIPNSMSVLSTLYPVLLKLMNENHSGTINLTNPGVIEHNEILQMYKELVANDFTWKNFTLEEQAKILAAGRSNNYLNTTKLETLCNDVPNIHNAVKETLINMRKNIE